MTTHDNIFPHAIFYKFSHRLSSIVTTKIVKTATSKEKEVHFFRKKGNDKTTCAILTKNKVIYISVGF